MRLAPILIFSLFISATGVSLLIAQPPNARAGNGKGYSLWTLAELAEQGKPYNPDPTGMAGGGLGSLNGHTSILVRRDKTGESESHATASDLMVVVDGHASIVIGGTITGNTRMNAPGEPRGTDVEGGEEKQIGPGDIIHLEPGTVHWVKIAAEPLTYFLVKLEQR